MFMGLCDFEIENKKMKGKQALAQTKLVGKRLDFMVFIGLILTMTSEILMQIYYNPCLSTEISLPTSMVYFKYF